MDDGRGAGYGQPSVWARRLGAGLAAATCCLLMLAGLNANLSGLLRSTQPSEVSSFRLFTLPPPAPPPSTQPRSRPDEAPQGKAPRPMRPIEPTPTGGGSGSLAYVLPAPPPISSSPAVVMVNKPAVTEPDVAPPRINEDQKQTVLAAYQRQLWARISARKPAGIHLDGVASVRFSVGEKGALTAVELAASSGNAALDRLALRTVRNAAPFPAPPVGVEGDQRVFTIPFSFH